MNPTRSYWCQLVDLQEIRKKVTCCTSRPHESFTVFIRECRRHLLEVGVVPCLVVTEKTPREHPLAGETDVAYAVGEAMVEGVMAMRRKERLA